MTRSEIAKAVWEAGEFGLTQVQAENVTKFVFQSVVDCIKRGESVNISGLGTFKCQVREARKGRNPKTGEVVSYPQGTKVKFKMSITIEKPSVQLVRANAA